MYLTPCSFPKNDFNPLSLSVSSFNRVVIEDDWHGTHVVSPFSRLYYIKSGGGIIRSDKKLYKMTASNIYLIPTGINFSHSSCGEMEKIYLHFTLPYGSADLMRSLPDILEIKRDEKYIQRIFTLFASDSPVDAFILKSLINNDICEFLRLYADNNLSLLQYSPAVSQAIKTISFAPKISITAESLAREQFVSVSFLSKLFKKETGITIGKFIDQAVFSAVQTMLIESDKSIDEIGTYYGFCDRFYFSARFKNLFGETPVQYRKKFKMYK